MNKIPTLLRLALRWFLNLTAKDFDNLLTAIDLFVGGQELLKAKPGIEKAQSVIEAALEYVPDSHRGLAKQIIKLLIEVVLIIRRRPQP